ncbi:MAG: glycosyltransferase [Phycisphaerales bacterium]
MGGAGHLVIGVCTYNRGGAITRTLGAIAGMERCGGRLARVVVVDNASTDGTGEVVDRFIAERGPADLRFERVYEGMPGKVAAMRRLFAGTSEEFIGIIDDDTVPEAPWGAAMLSLMDDQPRAGIVSGPVRNIWETGPTRLARVYRRSLGDQDFGPRRVELTEPMSFLMGASLVIRRSALDESGWMQGSRLVARTGPSLECGAEDAEVCVRIRQAGWGVWYEPGAKMGHLIPARRQTAAYLADLRGAICRGEPMLRWVAGVVGSREEAEREGARARRLCLKTLLFDWRPTRRRVRLAERRGRVEGWREVAARLSAERPPHRGGGPANAGP